MYIRGSYNILFYEFCNFLISFTKQINKTRFSVLNIRFNVTQQQ
jgi:hypothetical protein